MPTSEHFSLKMELFKSKGSILNDVGRKTNYVNLTRPGLEDLVRALLEKYPNDKTILLLAFSSLETTFEDVRSGHMASAAKVHNWFVLK